MGCQARHRSVANNPLKAKDLASSWRDLSNTPAGLALHPCRLKPTESWYSLLSVHTGKGEELL
jgi:hypothetical protein